jgi:hypothetical protein
MNLRAKNDLDGYCQKGAAIVVQSQLPKLENLNLDPMMQLFGTVAHANYLEAEVGCHKYGK